MSLPITDFLEQPSWGDKRRACRTQDSLCPQLPAEVWHATSLAVSLCKQQHRVQRCCQSPGHVCRNKYTDHVTVWDAQGSAEDHHCCVLGLHAGTLPTTSALLVCTSRGNCSCVRVRVVVVAALRARARGRKGVRQRMRARKRKTCACV